MIVWLLNIYIDCLYGNRYIFLSFFFLYFLESTFSLLSVHVFLFSYILSYRVIARSSISVFIGCVHFGHTSKRMQKYKSFVNAKGERWTYKYGFLLRRRFMNEWKCWSERASVKEIDRRSRRLYQSNLFHIHNVHTDSDFRRWAKMMSIVQLFILIWPTWQSNVILFCLFGQQQKNEAETKQTKQMFTP